MNVHIPFLPCQHQVQTQLSFLLISYASIFESRSLTGMRRGKKHGPDDILVNIAPKTGQSSSTVSYCYTVLEATM
eukprot:g38192.t1